MKLGLVFTNDWELYGDGSGDFWDVQYYPMIEFLDVLEQYGAKMTIMAELGQQLSYKSISEFNNDAKKISDAWDYLIVDAIKRKHDVQLHFHPQWLGAKYNEKWELTKDWSIGKLDVNEVEKIISTGKNYLESILHQHDSNYQCICFRAGAYYIEPSEKVVQTLIKYNFLCDTSVTKGLISDGYFDYSHAYSNVLPYFLSNDVKFKSPEETSLLEIPIYSKIAFQSNVLKKFFPKLYLNFWSGLEIPHDEIQWANQRDILKNQRYPREKRFYKQNQKKNLSFYLNQILSKVAIQLDYDYLYPTEFVNILEKIFDDDDIKHLQNKDVILPIVSSGHIKDVPDTKNIDKILKLIKQNLGDKIVFMTLSEAVKYFFENKSKF